MGPYSDREIIIEGVFKEKEDAIISNWKGV
jgi:hypothetical protein|nr:MAG TPA: hypothetical protein [Caudoviricetes sp.]